MKTRHAVAAALLTGLVTMLGTYAVTRTTELDIGASTGKTKNVNAQVVARTRQLNATEIALRKALTKKPPALPALPAPARIAKAQTAAQPQIQYVIQRPVAQVTRTTVRAAAPAARRARHETDRGDGHSAPRGGGSDD